MEPLKIISDQIEYELVRVISEGGMGTIYEGRQKGADGFEKLVAIKLILAQYSAVHEFRANFIGEAKLVADLIHTNIVQTYHFGQKDLQYYMVMEYVNGINLEDFMIRHLEIKEDIPVALAVFLVSRVCRGLNYAHKKRGKDGELLNIVHRDVSPRNIMLGFEGDVKLMDFGIAKARDLMYNKEGDVIAGKDEYLSPEQALKQVTDSRADIFSCGILLSELILGYNIFEAESPKVTRRNIVHGEIPDFTKLNAGIDDRLNGILHKALKGSRDERYQTAGELLTDLEVYLYGGGYGPTNEKLGKYIRDVFDSDDATAIQRWQESIQTRRLTLD